MDTSPKYILMCEKAEEIQKEWKPDVGDYVDPSGVVSIITSAYQPDEGYCLIGTNNINSYGQMHPKSMFFWLPRQDQLQTMIDDPIGVIIIHFYNWLCNQWVPIYEKSKIVALEGFDSFEQLWLAFVMHEKYQKQWDEEKGEWTNA